MARRPSYRKALKDARAELQGLFREREELERRIARARQGVIALARLCEPDIDAPRDIKQALVEGESMGLTSAIRTVLMASRIPLDPLAIRNELEGVGYDIGASPNTLVSIHTILKRLVANGEATHVATHSKQRDEHGPLWEDDGYWWGQHGIPKGWHKYHGPFGRKQMAAWRRNSKKAADDEARERVLEAKALKGED